MKRFFDWLLRNYECCEEWDSLAFDPLMSEWVERLEEGGEVRYYHPAAMKGQRPRYPGDGAVV